jgi:hypothetical protein
MTELRQDLYLDLIDRLLKCPNGREPEVLDAYPDLLDAELVQTLVRVATQLAHEDNQDASRFLIHIARELARQLGLYPQVSARE